jgi:signal transduction histidine kinase
MKAKLLFHNAACRNVYSGDQESGSAIVGLNKQFEQRLAECALEVQEKTIQLRAMASKLAQVEQREREQLAAILHDNLQQLLVAVRLQIGIVNPLLLPVGERKALSRADEIIGQAITDSRILTTDLSPPILHGAGLGAALEWLARRMAEQHCFTVDLSIDRRAEPQTESLRILLFETMRELLFNSCKHSGCDRALVEITGEQDSWVRVVVEDAGKGFDAQALSASVASGERLGLFGIQQRLAHADVRMTLASEPGVGTRVEILALIDCRDRVGNRQSRERTGPEVRWESEPEDALGVLMSR